MKLAPHTMNVVFFMNSLIQSVFTLTDQAFGARCNRTEIRVDRRGIDRRFTVYDNAFRCEMGLGFEADALIDLNKARKPQYDLIVSCLQNNSSLSCRVSSKLLKPSKKRALAKVCPDGNSARNRPPKPQQSFGPFEALI